MLRTGNLLLAAVLPALVCCVAMLTGCGQPEEPARPKPAPTNKLTSAEVRALAKERFLAQKRKIPPYDASEGLREVLFELYKVDLSTIFPDGKYDLSKLQDEKEVTEIVEARAAEAIAKDFPESRLAELKKEVLAKFPYHKVGDVVTATIKRPDGTTFEKKGMLMVVVPKGITVDGTRILYQDLLKPDRSTFYKDQVERKRSSYIYNLYILPKGEAKKKAKDALAESVYAELGCAKTKDGWVSVKTLKDLEIQQELEKRERAYYKAEESKIQLKIAEDLRNEGLL